MFDKAKYILKKNYFFQRQKRRAAEFAELIKLTRIFTLTYSEELFIKVLDNDAEGIQEQPAPIFIKQMIQHF